MRPRPDSDCVCMSVCYAVVYQVVSLTVTSMVVEVYPALQIHKQMRKNVTNVTTVTAKRHQDLLCSARQAVSLLQVEWEYALQQHMGRHCALVFYACCYVQTTTTRPARDCTVMSLCY